MPLLPPTMPDSTPPQGDLFTVDSLVPESTPQDAAPPDDAAEAFVGFLFKLAGRDDRAALAQIRRAHTEGTDEAMLRVIGAAVPETVGGAWLDAYLLTAGLFASYTTGAKDIPSAARLGRRRSLGGSARLARGTGASESFETRFAALLARPLQDLPEELRRVLRLLRSHDVPVDFTQLLRDLLRWEHPDRLTQRQWAQDFWQASTSDT